MRSKTAYTFLALASVLGLCALCPCLLVAIVRDPAAAPRKDAASKPAARPDPEKQADRERFIEKLKRAGYIRKLETPGTLPRVYVTPKFMALDIDAKTQFAGVVFAYHFDRDGDGTPDDPTGVLRIFHSISGRQVGTFDSFGLHLD